MMVDFFEKLGPTLVGLAAIAFAYWTTSRQIRANTVSTSRQRWIDSLQDVLSRFLGNTMSLAIIPDESDSPRVMHELHEGKARLSLMLKTGDAEQLTLDEAVYHLVDVCSDTISNTASDDDQMTLFEAATDAVVTAARKVIATEWSKIKRGD